MVKARLHDEPADDEKSDAAREHPEAAQRDHNASRALAHLPAFEIPLENGPIAFDELPDCDPDCDQADQHRQGSAGRVVENGQDRLLGGIAGRATVPD